jgi:hypothetical protein
MAWNNYNSNYSENNKNELAYDLRQGFAKRLNEHLDEISRCRINKDYKRWLDLLDSLYMEVSKKLLKRERDKYNYLLSKANETIKEHSEVFNSGKGDASKIYSALKKLNVWIETKMEKYKMFGAKDSDEGLF